MDSMYRDLVQKISISPDKKTKQKNYMKHGALAIVDQGRELIGGYTNDVSMCVPCNLPVIVFGDHTRAVKYVNFPFGAGADGIKILQPKPSVFPKYLYYATQYLVLRLENKGYARHYQHLEKKELNIPSIPEQERIVARIEDLFFQLDIGVETLKKIKRQLAVYRQAVLKATFEGCTETRLVEQVCSHVTDGDHFPPPKANTGIPFIMISDIDDGKVKWENTHYVSKEYYSKIGEKRTPQKGDVLYTVTGSYGIPILVDFEKEFCFQRHIALLRPNEHVIQKYLYYVMRSPYVYQQATAKATGTAQKTVALSVLRKIMIPYCSVNKQIYLVSELDNSLSVCDSIEQTIDTALQQADALRQSILKEAFEGELI